MSEQNKWQVKVHTWPLGDTGDYSSEIELSNGKIKLHCYDETIEEEEMQEIADEFNNYQSENARLKEENEEVKRFNSTLINKNIDLERSLSKVEWERDGESVRLLEWVAISMDENNNNNEEILGFRDSEGNFYTCQELFNQFKQSQLK